MNARRTGQLGQPADGLLNIFGGHHHQIGQLVNQHHNLRQLHHVRQLVISNKILHAGVHKHQITPIHLVDNFL